MSRHRFIPGVTPAQHRASRMLADRNQRARAALVLAKFTPTPVRTDFVLAGQKGGQA